MSRSPSRWPVYFSPNVSWILSASFVCAELRTFLCFSQRTKQFDIFFKHIIYAGVCTADWHLWLRCAESPKTYKLPNQRWRDGSSYSRLATPSKFPWLSSLEKGKIGIEYRKFIFISYFVKLPSMTKRDSFIHPAVTSLPGTGNSSFLHFLVLLLVTPNKIL